MRPGAVSLERAEFALAQGRLTLAGASFADQRFTARGDFEAIAVDRLVQSLQRLAPEAIDPSLVRPTGLVLRGRFELAGASVDDLTGNASFDTRSTLFDAHSQGQLTFASGNVEGSLRLRRCRRWPGRAASSATTGGSMAPCASTAPSAGGCVRRGSTVR